MDKNLRNGQRKYTGISKEQQMKGCHKVSSPGATGMNFNLPDKLWKEPGW